MIFLLRLIKFFVNITNYNSCPRRSSCHSRKPFQLHNVIVNKNAFPRTWSGLSQSHRNIQEQEVFLVQTWEETLEVFEFDPYFTSEGSNVVSPSGVSVRDVAHRPQSNGHYCVVYSVQYRTVLSVPAVLGQGLRNIRSAPQSVRIPTSTSVTFMTDRQPLGTCWLYKCMVKSDVTRAPLGIGNRRF